MGITEGVGSVMGIFICPEAGAAMQEVQEAEVIAGQGIKGDRYATGHGSWNKGSQGKRQVTFINSRFVTSSGFQPRETRRNILTVGIELSSLIGQEFSIGSARFKGVKYCAPCERPNRLLKRYESFKETFQDCGGLIAEVIESGTIHLGQPIIS